MKTDFLFRVTELEFEVINLGMDAPILLMGRSGTGKTTCCLYRLWTQFLKYWTKAKEIDYAPWLSWKEVPVTVAEDGNCYEAAEFQIILLFYFFKSVFCDSLTSLPQNLVC